MIYISYAAKKYLAKLLMNQQSGTQLRIFVTYPGTHNAECGISYCLPNTVKSNDIELKFGSFSAYIDEISFPYLKDAEIDLINDKISSQLTLKAPNVKVRKIRDDSPLIERVQYVIQSQINPQLANHGGVVFLIEITKDMFAIIKFGGGCNGCSMIDYTLKEGIEKELLMIFPELKGVKDITEHQHSITSYY